MAGLRATGREREAYYNIINNKIFSALLCGRSNFFQFQHRGEKIGSCEETPGYRESDQREGGDDHRLRSRGRPARSLYEAIWRGDLPRWKLEIEIVPEPEQLLG